MNPYTLGVLILVLVVACAEINSFRRLHNLRRYEKTVKEKKA